METTQTVDGDDLQQGCLGRKGQEQRCLRKLSEVESYSQAEGKEKDMEGGGGGCLQIPPGLVCDDFEGRTAIR